MNEFQPVAEQQILTVFALTGRWDIDYGANEDLSGFGTLGGPALAVAGAAALVRGRREARALGLALPLFLVLLALTSKYNPWLTRFVLFPAALTARLFTRRAAALAIAAVGIVTLARTLARNQLKPLGDRPWRFDQAAALRLTWKPTSGGAYDDLERRVPHAGRELKHVDLRIEDLDQPPQPFVGGPCSGSTRGSG